MYLLDTDILSNLLKRAPSTTLIARLAAVPPEQQFTSSMTLGELIFGAYRLGEQAEVLLQRIQALLLPNLAILPFDAAAARRYGATWAAMERHGVLIEDVDLRIAAITQTHNLTVVTANVRHFQRVPGLAVANWLE